MEIRYTRRVTTNQNGNWSTFNNIYQGPMIFVQICINFQYIQISLDNNLLKATKIKN